MSKPKIDVSGIKKHQPFPETNKQSRISSIKFDNESEDVIFTTTQDSYNEELFGERESNMRFYNFVWLYLFLRENADFEEENIGIKESTLADIEHFFQKKCSDRDAQKLARFIRKEFRIQHIPIETTDWISRSTRATKWIKGKIAIFDQDNIQQFTNLNGLSLIHATLDQWDARSSLKVKLISEFQKKWEANIKTDHELSWLEETSHAKARRSLAWNKLCEDYGSTFNADRVPSTHQDILEIFDQLVDEGFSKKKFIRGLQKENNKQKNIDDGRKPKNLGILLVNHAKLKELADLWQVPEYAAMDRLISDTFKNELGKEAPTPN
ncbi:hypothetical protein DY966_02405 [Pseudomonas aeruginosa]|uniref:hypothetical protein n=1 Tax=Pseudomonas aeruginosa TaxID=287 RepID=UPI000F81F92D|nr:hypothetical protein [Pseudomonas aeruginosa]ELS1859419.1 hypothetical protein [Pseudomonas aeruginosa]RTU07394.1 hypothetical protein DY966_02405 [Pseudomonas aeruginosa]